MKNNNEININKNITGVNEMESEEESAIKQQLQQPPGNNDEGEVDEVDYVPVSNGNVRNGILKSNNDLEKSCVVCNGTMTDHKDPKDKRQLSNIFKLKPKISDCEVKVCVKNNLHTLDKLQLFKFYQRKRSDPTMDRIVSPTQKKPKFTKSITIARLFGNNYNPKNSIIDAKNKNILTTKPPAYKSEKFLKADTETTNNGNTSNEDTQSLSGSSVLSTETYAARHPHHVKPFKTLSRSFGKLLRRNYSSVDISIPDPEYKVSYLGNVLTGWARGKSMLTLLFYYSSLWSKLKFNDVRKFQSFHNNNE